MSTMYDLVKGLIYIPMGNTRFDRSIKAIYKRYPHGKRSHAKGGTRPMDVDHWIKRIKREMAKV